MNFDYYMDPAVVEEMIQGFTNTSNRLKDMMAIVDSIAASLEDGTLQGRGGNELADAFRGGFIPSVNALDARIEDTINELRQAIEDHNEGTGTIRSKFSG